MNNKSTYKPSTLEKETVMIFNQLEPLGEVYTCNYTLTKKLRKLCLNFPTLFKIKYQDKYSLTVSLPKKYIGVSSPRLAKKKSDGAGIANRAIS